MNHSKTKEREAQVGCSRDWVAPWCQGSIGVGWSSFRGVFTKIQRVYLEDYIVVTDLQSS